MMGSLAHFRDSVLSSKSFQRTDLETVLLFFYVITDIQALKTQHICICVSFRLLCLVVSMFIYIALML